jgi:hypothetical protein
VNNTQHFEANMSPLPLLAVAAASWVATGVSFVAANPFGVVCGAASLVASCYAIRSAYLTARLRRLQIERLEEQQNAMPVHDE